MDADVRAKVDAWLKAQGFPQLEAEVTGAPADFLNEVRKVLDATRHDPIGQAFVLFHGIEAAVKRAETAA